MTNAVRRWLFDPVDTAPMAALRIACGLLALGWTVSLLPDLGTFLDRDGLMPHAFEGSGGGWWSVDLASPYPAVALLVAASIALVLGWHTRVAAVVVAVLLLVLQRRDVYILNSGDSLLRQLAIYLALMPAGEMWSLDARRRGASSARAPWGLRMLQIQISVVYFFSVVAKLHGDAWQDGTAVGRSVQLADLQRIVVPESLATSITLSALATYGTLIVEGALVFGLWLPRFRWWVMAAGVSIHLGIEATLLIGWFSLTIIACYLAFVPPEVLRRVVGQVLARVRPQPEPLPVPAVPSRPVPQATSGPPPSPDVAVGWGEHEGHEAGKRLEVRITPSADVGAEVGAAERPGDDAVSPVVGEKPLDPVDGQAPHAFPVVRDEPPVPRQDREDPAPPPGPPGVG